MRSAALALVLSFNLPGDPIPPDGTVNIAQSPEDLRAKVNAQVLKEIRPSSNWRLSFPQQGRADTPMAASAEISVIALLKFSGGVLARPRH
jgi:hypothetical protein